METNSGVFLNYTYTCYRYKEEISKLHVLPRNVAKIVPEKILSMAFHPTSTRPILCAGDKWGSIGFWDIVSHTPH